MSATFYAAAKALADNPELLAKFRKLSTAEERAAHFIALGVAVPTLADVYSHVANMAAVTGGVGTETGEVLYTGPPATAAAAAASP